MPGLINEYNNENKRLCNYRVKVACCLGIIFVPLFGLLDRFTIPSHFLFFMKMRLAVSFILAIILLLHFTKIGARYPEILGILIFASVGIMIAHMTRYLGGYKSTYYAGINLLFLAMAILMPWRLKYSIIPCVIVYSFYLLPIFLFDKIDNFPLLLNNNFFLASTITVALTSNYVNYRLRFQEFQARHNLAEAKDNLEEAYGKLKELDTLKTQFFSNISHEFRTPLTLILAPAESMLKGDSGIFTPQVKKEVSVIYDNSLRLLRLIDDLLDITKIDAQKMELDLQKCDIVELIKGVVSSVENIARKKGLKVYYAQKGEIPDFYLDRDKMEKVLLNLLSNALKFTDEGEIEISSEKSGQKAVIKVRDTGIGIAEKDLPKMFDRFTQLDGSAARRHEGTGLGLSLSRDLVRLHQGNIKIESELNTGTTMIVELPLDLKEDNLPSKLPGKDDWIKEIHKKAQYVGQGVMEEKVNPGESAALKKGRGGYVVLAVEDNPDMRNFITLQLEKDYQVVGAKNGREGLETARKILPDLIVSDIMMPEMSGYDLLKAVREDYGLKNIPVIFLTAKAGLDMKIEGLKYGADDYLVKPFNSEELLARVKNLIMIRELQQELYRVAKMASVGQLAAGTAHEINNPLSASMSELRVLKKALNGPAREADRERLNGLIEKSYASLERIERIVSNLLSFSRKNREGLKPDDVHEGLNSTLSVLGHEIKDGISLHKQFCPDGKIECDLGKLNQVFMNVLLNSIQAIKNSGNIWIRTARHGHNFVVSIRDDGEGIEKSSLDRVFEPFFTTKEPGQGVGLGLTVSYNLIKEHGGDMAIESEPGRGTEVMITVPLQSEAKG